MKIRVKNLKRWERIKVRERKRNTYVKKM